MQLGEKITQEEAIRRGQWISVYADAAGKETAVLATLVGPLEPIQIRMADKPLRGRNVGIFAVPTGTSAPAPSPVLPAIGPE